MKRQRVLQVSDEDRVRFALRLAGADMPALSSRSLRSLWRAYRAFVGLPPSSGVAKVVNGHRAGDALFNDERRRQALTELQGDARALLEQVRRGARISAPLSGVSIEGDVGKPLSQTYRGEPATIFRAALVMLLLDEPGSHVRVCPECESLFYRVRRQIYCSARCTDRANWRAYPEQKKRRARRKEYEKYGWTLGAHSRGEGR